MSKPLFCFILLMLLLPGLAQENTPPLERLVTLSAQNKPIENILDDISAQTGIVFSYNPKAMNSSNPSSVQASQKPVRLVLHELFGNTIHYKTRGKYIILRKANLEKEVAETKQKWEGYIYDSQTGEKLTGASVYDKNMMASTVTDQYGYFSMELPYGNSATSLRVSKNGYSDTTLQYNNLEKGIRTLELTINKADSAKQKKPFFNLPNITPKWLIPENIKLHSLNISDTMFRFIQFSFIPGVSTNKLLGGNAYNDVSFNILGGYIQGVNLAEFGGIVNIVRENASYAQLGGVGNIVGGHFKGVQAAGIFSYARTIDGVQLSGIANAVFDSALIQAAGIANHANDTYLQAAGILNNSGYANIQVAGIMNRSSESDFQISGIGNLSTRIRDFQVGGIFNHSCETGLFQVAGIVNNSQESVGTQVSGILNIAKNVRRFQVGLINISDSCGGVPIGLFNYMNKGYHKLEFSADEIFPFNVSFRTGVRVLHTFATTGLSLFNPTNPTFHAGYGIGTSIQKWDKTLMDFDLSVQHIFDRENFHLESNLFKIYAGIDRAISPKFSIAAGITYNFLFTNIEKDHFREHYLNLAPYSISNANLVNGNNLKTWFGGKIAVRFF